MGSPTWPTDASRNASRSGTAAANDGKSAAFYAAANAASHAEPTSKSSIDARNAAVNASDAAATTNAADDPAANDDPATNAADDAAAAADISATSNDAAADDAAATANFPAAATDDSAAAPDDYPAAAPDADAAARAAAFSSSYDTDDAAAGAYDPDSATCHVRRAAAALCDASPPSADHAAAAASPGTDVPRTPVGHVPNACCDNGADWAAVNAARSDGVIGDAPGRPGRTDGLPNSAGIADVQRGLRPSWPACGARLTPLASIHCIALYFSSTSTAFCHFGVP
jgi:hypothetical protein